VLFCVALRVDVVSWEKYHLIVGCDYYAPLYNDAVLVSRPARPGIVRRVGFKHAALRPSRFPHQLLCTSSPHATFTSLLSAVGTIVRHRRALTDSYKAPWRLDDAM